MFRLHANLFILNIEFKRVDTINQYFIHYCPFKCEITYMHLDFNLKEFVKDLTALDRYHLLFIFIQVHTT